jgi:hypothetical protein
MLLILQQAPQKDWLRFLLVANELRGMDNLANMWPQLEHQYRAGWTMVGFICQHLDVAHRILIG